MQGSSAIHSNDGEENRQINGDIFSSLIYVMRKVGKILTFPINGRISWGDLENTFAISSGRSVKRISL